MRISRSLAAFRPVSTGVPVNGGSGNRSVKSVIRVRVTGNPTRLIVLNERKICWTGNMAAPVKRVMSI